MLTKEIWIGDERGYCCRISKTVFGEREYGSREEAKRAAVHHCCTIIKQQTADGVPKGATIKERRRIYHKSP
jgi:hypothetical protein